MVRLLAVFRLSRLPASQTSSESRGTPVVGFTLTFPSAPRLNALRYPRQKGREGFDWKAAR